MPVAPYDRLLDQLVRASHKGADASSGPLPTEHRLAPPPRPSWAERRHRLAQFGLGVLEQVVPTLSTDWIQAQRQQQEIKQAYQQTWAAWPAKKPIYDALQDLAQAWQDDGYFDKGVHLQPDRPENVGWVSTADESDRHTIGLGINPKGQLWSLNYDKDLPGLQTKAWESTPVFLKWLVLAHEIAHTVLAQEPHPLKASPDHPWGDGIVDGLNDHLFGVGALGDHAKWFHEAFSDVYGSMMVLRSSGFHLQAQQEVRLLANVRDADHQLFRANLHGQLGERLVTGLSVSPYDTSAALDQLMSTRVAWEHLPVDQLRTHAMAIVSEVFWERALAFEASPSLVFFLPPIVEAPRANVIMREAMIQGTGSATLPSLHVRDEEWNRQWEVFLAQAEDPNHPLGAAVQQARQVRSALNTKTYEARTEAYGHRMNTSVEVEEVLRKDWRFRVPWAFPQSRNEMAEAFGEAVDRGRTARMNQMLEEDSAALQFGPAWLVRHYLAQEQKAMQTQIDAHLMEEPEMDWEEQVSDEALEVSPFSAHPTLGQRLGLLAPPAIPSPVSPSLRRQRP